METFFYVFLKNIFLDFFVKEFIMNASYYLLNKHKWKPGGKYYKYKSNPYEGYFKVSHGVFFIEFN